MNDKVNGEGIKQKVEIDDVCVNRIRLYITLQSTHKWHHVMILIVMATLKSENAPGSTLVRRNVIHRGPACACSACTKLSSSGSAALARNKAEILKHSLFSLITWKYVRSIL